MSSSTLDRLLTHLGIAVEPFAVCRVHRGWSLEMAAPAEIHLHFVVEGDGLVRAGSFSAPIGPHTLIVVPTGMNHRVEPSDGGKIRALGQATCDVDALGLDNFSVGTEGGIVMTCGRLQATYEVTRTGLFDALRQPLVVRFDDAGIGRLFDGMMSEQREPKPGSRRMIELLMEQLLVHLLRVVSADEEMPWLQALEDPRFARVLETIFDDPSANHTLDSLALVAGMSRSSFSERFTAVFGRSAVDLVKELRLRRAAKLLRTSDLAVKEIASEVGFGSRSHVSRAFKAAYGIDPASYRS
ncbi:MAG: AraC family transcriptional regulator [Myxococcota bacterium]